VAVAFFDGSGTGHVHTIYKIINDNVLSSFHWQFMSLILSIILFILIVKPYVNKKISAPFYCRCAHGKICRMGLEPHAGNAPWYGGDSKSLGQ